MPAQKPIAETAKQRSLRVGLDYYQQRDPLVRFKYVLGAAATALAGAYIAWLLVAGNAGRRHAMPGSVAAVHATIESDCAKCHQRFRPLKADALDLVSLVTGGGQSGAPRDAGCLACHAGHSDHNTARPAEIAACTACHSDHQGRNANIVRPSDRECTRCHASIELHRDRTQITAKDVWGFGPPNADGTGPHPRFRSLPDESQPDADGDPGNIKFNHWLHLQPGVAAANSKKQMRVSDIALAERPPGSTATAGGLIQLACSSCHQDGSEDNPSAGAYRQPISYERHCQVCHPLELKGADNPETVQPVPHRLTPGGLYAVLDGLLLADARARQAKPAATADESGNEPLIPGKTLGKNLSQKLSADLLGKRSQLAAALQATCSECHYFQPSAAGQPGELTDVLPAQIPQVWLKHARFDHRAHQDLEFPSSPAGEQQDTARPAGTGAEKNCRHCHAQAYPDKPRLLERAGMTLPSGFEAARDDRQVMIGNIEVCAQCHAPATNGLGGARHDCAECHRYHSSSHPREDVVVEGRRSKVEGPMTMTTFDFRPAKFDLRLVSTAAAPATAPPGWVGFASCATTGCHGATHTSAPQWQRAVTTWLARDPHVQAYEVLWTFRGREMTRLLSSTGDPEPLSDDGHRAVLAERCVGCHATPTSHGPGETPHSYALGVNCESCHGPAGDWLHTHYRSDFSRGGSEGFVDTKDVQQRAGVCMGCHVGPSTATGQPQVVDHDLIAAGHPRLDFEFRTYFASLPPHWDQAKDWKSAGSTGAFHYRAWLAGQIKRTEQTEQLASHYRPSFPKGHTDFAALDCFACHHSLAGAQWRQRSSAGKSGDLTHLMWRSVAAADSGAGLAQAWDFPAAKRLQSLSEILARTASASPLSWLQSSDAYLAGRAVLADLDAQRDALDASQLAAYKQTLEQLGGYLAQDAFVPSSSPGRQVSVYDSPTYFESGEASRRMRAVKDALDRLARPTSPAP